MAALEPVVSLEILLVEDDPALRAMLVKHLPEHRIREAATLEEARQQLLPLPDVVLTDVHLGAESGLDLAGELQTRQPGLPVIVMTAFGDLSVAIDALRSGAWDFLTKPLDLEVLRAALDRAGELHRLRREVRALRRQARSTEPFQGLVGESPVMAGLFRLLERAAAVPSSVLVRGESGTGKELVARALHQASPRAERPFVPLNCAAVPEALLEGELFGHTKGAFTDAHADRTGLVLEAHTGTLFLDEIGDMPMAVQAKLLRVLQERRVRPLGTSRDVGVDVRVVAATHQDLDVLVERGLFREDLLYRLDVLRIDVPPLRDRGTDILLLAQRFLSQFSERFGRSVGSISPEAMAKLMDHRWPGNVRELQNCVERAVVLCDGDVLGVDDLPDKVRRARVVSAVPAAVTGAAAGPLLSLAELERRHIEAAMAALDGHRGKVAEALGIDRKTLYRKLSSYGYSA